MESSEAANAYQHNKDFAILTIQLGHVSESQTRIEKTLYDFRGEWKKDIDRLSADLKLVDDKHTKEIENLKTKIYDDDKTNSNFRTKVTVYATVGAAVGGGVWQVLFHFLIR